MAEKVKYHGSGVAIAMRRSYTGSRSSLMIRKRFHVDVFDDVSVFSSSPENVSCEINTWLMQTDRASLSRAMPCLTTDGRVANTMRLSVHARRVDRRKCDQQSSTVNERCW